MMLALQRSLASLGSGKVWLYILGPALAAVGRQLWWQEFKRDEAFIEQLEQDLWDFKLLVDYYETQLRKKPHE